MRGKPTDGPPRESTLDLDGTKVFFGRAEYVREMGGDLPVAPLSRVFDLGE